MSAKPTAGLRVIVTVLLNTLQYYYTFHLTSSIMIYNTGQLLSPDLWIVIVTV